ncbi:hypothetical protein PR048_016090 [Dryococelus australis]|uniref:Uncharacterized protein n=1 Tax=Dryococelus australis TaxID=614101 RepID=A0ABQ9HIS3_9NEOP|nr:hypothetical protein PR048_016090 [Dryococelus australis]
MHGQFNGVQAHVPSAHPLAVYLHCSSLEEATKDLRENVHTEFRKVIVEVEKKAKDTEVDIIAPRRVRREMHRVNISSKMVESA